MRLKTIINPFYQRNGLLLLALICAPVGCASDAAQYPKHRMELPAVSEGYRTDPFEQWIEVDPLFPNDPSPAVIIRCRGGNTVAQWETHTISWPEAASDMELRYQAVSIQVHDHYGYDSGPVTSQNAYWPVDINGDGLDDLLVLGWGTGNPGRHVEKENGERVYIRVPYDGPTHIRLIQRKEIKGSPFGIDRDETVEWKDVLAASGCYRVLLRKALIECHDQVWQARLMRALTELTD